MIKQLLFLLLFLQPAFCIAQVRDSLLIRAENEGRWSAQYHVQGERSVFEVAKKFGVPAAVLADANRLSYTDKLVTGATVSIPLTLANWYNNAAPASSIASPLYYRAAEEWDAKDLAKRLGVSKRQLQDWNESTDDDIEPGQVLVVGWISLGSAGRDDGGQSRITVSSPPPPVQTIVAEDMADTAKPIPALAPMEQAFLDQTAGGTMVTAEKGPAAFFPATGGTSKGVHYAFHNTASRGSIVRVQNIGTGRTVYVKVLGPMPRTKQYAGAVIGISSAAKAELGVRGDVRAFCEVSYAGY